jgi:hypothetical protein
VVAVPDLGRAVSIADRRKRARAVGTSPAHGPADVDHHAHDRGIAATWLFQHAADTQNVRFRAIPIAAAGDPRGG